MNAPLLVAEHLVKSFRNGVRAVDDVSFEVGEGETLGIVGESGSGKSTSAKIALRLLRPDSGDVFFRGQKLFNMSQRYLAKTRQRLQLVPQNPQTSLNPRLTVASSLAFNLEAHGWRRAAIKARIEQLLERVGLDPAYADRHPHQLSGGQLQRVAIARAISTDPHLVVCDEAVSALDKSVQAQILNLLATLQQESGVSYLFISHDLAVVEHFSDRVAVMLAGTIVETGDAGRLWAAPQHPYTKTLLASAPGVTTKFGESAAPPPS